MANTYSWIIGCLYTKNSISDGTTYNDVIKKAEATLRVTNSANQTADAAIDMDFNDPSDWSNFTEYSSVTKANVVSWIEGRLGSQTLSQIKARLDQQLIEDANVANTTAKGTGTHGEESFSATFPWD
tara:strand:- start:5129 stop:5509 length:381 start_codon:yes stop_codon:yes gene_type:complete